MSSCTHVCDSRLSTAVTMEVWLCGSCGCQFAAPEELIRGRRNAGGSIWCSGCGASYSWGRTEKDRLRDQIKRAEARLARERAAHDQTQAELEQTEFRRRAEKAAKTRLKNRIGAGVCPCCNRTFQNLARHMENQHPGYSQEGTHA